MKYILDFLFKRTLGRVLLVGLLLILGAYVGRIVYVDIPRAREADERRSGAERLEQIAASFDDALGDHGAQLEETLPARSEWYPPALPCAATKKAPAEREPIWDVLGIEPGEELSFQYRFEHEGDRFTLRARRDTDCDGLHVVHVLTGRTDWTSLLGTSSTVENSGE